MQDRDIAVAVRQTWRECAIVMLLVAKGTLPGLGTNRDEVRFANVDFDVAGSTSHNRKIAASTKPLKQIKLQKSNPTALVVETRTSTKGRLG
ncbi:hypothetical protein [Cylindrospermum stagnale]|uniref:hypothetical protein n=1 Tax=Cylindrospermum stagnale TaxID=142864 RepID=UPI0012F62C82|nr:hypothetical protein [Cylindrospermum stagnale]